MDKTPIIITAAIIESGGKLLIAKRSEGSAKGKWEFPGGKMEYGETAEACLKREIQEELGCEIRVGALFDVTTFIASDGRHLVIIFYNCSVTAGTPHAKEHEEILWVLSKDLMNYDFTKADSEAMKRLM